MTHAGGGSHDGSDGGSTDSTSDSGPTIIVQKIPLPNWLKSLAPVADTLRALGRFIQEKGSFRKAVLAVVTGWVIGGVLQLVGTVIEAVLLLFSPFLRAVGTTQAAVANAFAVPGQAVLDAMMQLNSAIAETVGVAGPVAPLISTTIVMGTLYLSYRLVVSIAGEFPVVSTIVDFLGLRP